MGIVIVFQLDILVVVANVHTAYQYYFAGAIVLSSRSIAVQYHTDEHGRISHPTHPQRIEQNPYYNTSRNSPSCTSHTFVAIRSTK